MLQGGGVAARGCTWYIRHVDLFKRLPEHDLFELTQAMTPRRVAAGELIVGPETRPEWVFVSRSGVVRMFHFGRRQRRVTVERLQPGHLFGITTLFGRTIVRNGGSLFADAETDVDLCCVEERRFVEVIGRWPQALLELATRLGVRIHEDQLGRASATGARARLARVLYDLCREATNAQTPGGLRLRAVPQHAELAEQIGASRETVTRMLARLEEDGYIRRYGRQIVVPDPRRLVEDFEPR